MLQYNFIKSPLSYTGCKYKNLKNLIQALKLSEEGFSDVYDLFAGSGTVLANCWRWCDRLHYNELDCKVFGIIEKILDKDISLSDLKQKIFETIEKFGLSKLDSASYYNFRDFYNSNQNSSDAPINLFLLSCYSFSNIIRFNKDGNFNAPFGQREFKNRTLTNLRAFKNCRFNLTNKDFAEVLKLDDGDADRNYCSALIYCDPPYLNAKATYNKGWDLNNELRLRSYLERLCQLKIRFAMSNDLNTNPTLQTWADDNNFKILRFDKVSYSSSFASKAKATNTKTKEVLIMNY